MLDLRSLENEVIDYYLDNELVYDDDGNLISGLEFRQKYVDEDYIQENTPLSLLLHITLVLNLVKCMIL